MVLSTPKKLRTCHLLRYETELFGGGLVDYWGTTSPHAVLEAPRKLGSVTSEEM